MIARIVQIIIKLVTFVLVGKWGMDAQAANSFTAPLTTLLIALGTFLLDLAIHSAQWGKIKAFWESLDNTPTAAPPGNDNSATRLYSMLAVGFLASALMLSSGCSAFISPTPINDQDRAIQQVNDAQLAYTVAITAVNVAYANHKISDAQMKAIIPLEQTAYAYLQAATDAAYAGKTVDAQTKRQLFYDALNRFTAAFAPPPPNIPGTPPVIVVPATQPASSFDPTPISP